MKKIDNSIFRIELICDIAYLKMLSVTLIL